MKYKVCYKCHKKLELNSDNFAISKKSSDGFDGRCKPCVNLISKKYRKDRGEEYRIDNISKAKERTLERLKNGKCYNCNSERLEHSNLYCEKHWFQYAAKHHLKSMKQWKELKSILENQKYKCCYTGLELIIGLNAGIDHKIPLSKNANLHQNIDNIQWVHSDINLMKRNHLENDFLNYIKLIYENRLSR
jgi:hypothetical protein